MPFPKLKTKTKVVIAGSTMLATSTVAIFIAWGVIAFAVGFVVGAKFRIAVIPEAPKVWRSAMLPENWEPIDKIGPVEGVNVFFDPRGIVDQSCANSAAACLEFTDACKREIAKCDKIMSGPAYHPYRFLHDFSYAGYRSGEKPIPPQDPNPDVWTKNVPVLDVTRSPYNCVPDGKMDCRAAIQAAIDAVGTSGGIVYLPAGEYRITAKNSSYFIQMRKNKVVLRGDGQNITKIKVDPNYNGVFDMDNKAVFQIGGGKYTDAFGKTYDNDGWIQMDSKSAKIKSNIDFPSRIIPVDDASLFTTNDPIIIQGDFTESFIAEHDNTGIWKTNWRPYAYKFRRSVVNVDVDKNKITIDVPTRYRIKTSDNARVYKTTRGLSEIGIEHMSFGMIRHPDEWEGDESLAIYKQIDHNILMIIENVRNSWLYDIGSYEPRENDGKPTDNTKYGKYDVEILNRIIEMRQSRFITVKNFFFKNMQVDGGGDSGGQGYGITLHANEVLIENGTLQKVKKPFAMQWGIASGNVIKDVTEKEVFTNASDFHGALSFANLIDNAALVGTFWEAAVRPLPETPDDTTRPDSIAASQNVFWNTWGTPLTITVRTWWDRDNDNDNGWDNPAVSDPGSIVSNQFGWGYVIGTYGPESRVVAARMPDRSVSENKWKPNILPRDYLEGIGYDEDLRYAGKVLEPGSLYEAQLKLRLAANKERVLFRRGYVDGNDRLQVSDALAILLYLFRGGEEPTCLDSADVNDDGGVNITDAKYLLGYMFSGSTLAPAEPFESCGVDPTPLDNLGCASFSQCGN